MLYHGNDDPMIDIHSAKLSYSMLDKYGLNYNLTVEKEMEHTISMDEIKKVSEFMHE